MPQVLTPLQEGQLEASSYPWCPDVWTISGLAAQAAANAAAAAGAAAGTGAGSSGEQAASKGSGSGSGSKGARKGGSKAARQQQQQVDQDAAAGAGQPGQGQDVAMRAASGGCEGQEESDPLHDLAVGTDVLRPLMPFVTAFQLLRAPVTAKGAGLRLKREATHPLD
jgi:hypothetical protein